MVSKKELASRVAERLYYPKGNCEQIIDMFLDEMKRSLIGGEKVSFKNFITIEPKETNERIGVDPRTGEKIVIPKRNKLKMTVSIGFKKELNG